MNWAAKCRRDFVGQYARKHGWISRSILVELFGISLAQASGDIQGFLEKYPDAIEYDMRKKYYRWNTELEAFLEPPAWEQITRLV